MYNSRYFQIINHVADRRILEIQNTFQIWKFEKSEITNVRLLPFLQNYEAGMVIAGLLNPKLQMLTLLYYMMKHLNY